MQGHRQLRLIGHNREPKNLLSQYQFELPIDLGLMQYTVSTPWVAQGTYFNPILQSPTSNENCFQKTCRFVLLRGGSLIER